MAPLGGIAELVASTGPNHATLLTGAPLAGHGVLANRVFAPDGGIDADPRVRIPTLLDRAKAAGRRTVIAASDPDILNTVKRSRGRSRVADHRGNQSTRHAAAEIPSGHRDSRDTHCGCSIGP